MIIVLIWLFLLPNRLPYFDIAWRYTPNTDFLLEFRVITDILDLNDHPVFGN
jgi:hypothetical protein